MSDKQAVIELIERMPDSVSLEQMIDQVALLQSLREGLADSNGGRVIPHQEVKRSFTKWFSK